jgi:hypothetical protein
METVFALNRIQRKEHRGTESCIPCLSIAEEGWRAVFGNSEGGLSDTPGCLHSVAKRGRAKKQIAAETLKIDDHGRQLGPADDSADYLLRPVTLAVAIPWLAQAVPILHIAAFLSARSPSSRNSFLLHLPRLGFAFRAESVHS